MLKETRVFKVTSNFNQKKISIGFTEKTRYSSASEIKSRNAFESAVDRMG